MPEGLSSVRNRISRAAPPAALVRTRVSPSHKGFPRPRQKPDRGAGSPLRLAASRRRLRWRYRPSPVNGGENPIRYSPSANGFLLVRSKRRIGVGEEDAVAGVAGEWGAGRVPRVVNSE